MISRPRPAFVTALMITIALASEPSAQTTNGGKRPPLATTPDLELQARVLTPRRTQAWWPITVEAWIINRSTTEISPYVAAGDGSFEDLREPHLSCELLLHDREGNVNIAPQAYGRCGNYDADWSDEVRYLAPRERRRLFVRELVPFPAPAEITRGALHVRYGYHAIPARATQWDALPLPEGRALGAMSGFPTFDIESAPAGLIIETPELSADVIESSLDLELRAPAASFSALDPVRLQGVVTNRSKRSLSFVLPRPYSFGRGATISLGVRERKQLTDYWTTEFYPGATYRVRDPDWRDEVITLAPGRSIDVAVPKLHEVVRLQGTSQITLELTYFFHARPVRPARPGRYIFRPDDLGAMRDIPPFRLTSMPLELEVVHPLELRIRQKMPFPKTRPCRLSELVELEVTNRSDQPIQLSTEDDPCRLRSLSILETMPAPSGGMRTGTTLAPSETLACLAANVFAGFDPVIEPRAELHPLASIQITLRREAWGEELRARLGLSQ